MLVFISGTGRGIKTGNDVNHVDVYFGHVEGN